MHISLKDIAILAWRELGKKTYFSDVFKKDGDAGGQYNYMNKIRNFRSFELSIMVSNDMIKCSMIN